MADLKTSSPLKSSNSSWRTQYEKLTVCTFCGSGARGFQDGPATETKFFRLAAITEISSGLLVVDSGNHCVRLIKRNGVSTTFAGIGGRGSSDNNNPLEAAFDSPHGVCAISDTQILITDTANHLIRVYNLGKGVKTYAGDGREGGSFEGPKMEVSFLYPRNLCYIPSVGIFVADSGLNRILKIGMDGNVQSFIGNGEEGDAISNRHNTNLFQPFSVIQGQEQIQQLIIGDTANHRILMAFWNSNEQVTKLAGSGRAGYRDGPALEAMFYSPVALVRTPTNAVLIAEYGTNHIRIFSPLTSSVGTFAGAGTSGYKDGLATGAYFTNPHGMHLDSRGNLFITEQGNDRIRLIKIPQWATEAGFSTTGEAFDFSYLLTHPTANLSHINFVHPSTSCQFIFHPIIVQTRCGKKSCETIVEILSRSQCHPRVLHTFFRFIYGKDQFDKYVPKSKASEHHQQQKQEKYQKDTQAESHQYQEEPSSSITPSSPLTLDLKDICDLYLLFHDLELPELTYKTYVYFEECLAQEWTELQIIELISHVVRKCNGNKELFALLVAAARPHASSLANEFKLLATSLGPEHLETTANLVSYWFGKLVISQDDDTILVKQPQTQLGEIFAELLEQEKFPFNFTIVVTSDKFIKCHSEILYARWPYFRNIVDAGLSEMKENKLQIAAGSMSFMFLNGLVYYLYTNSVSRFPPGDEDYETVLANMFLYGFVDMDGKPTLGFETLVAYMYSARTIDLSNCIRYFKIVQHMKSSALFKVCRNFIIANLKEIFLDNSLKSQFQKLPENVQLDVFYEHLTPKEEDSN